jgi:hypothetical protein
MPHITLSSRKFAASAVLVLLLACLGLSACGGSNSSKTANAAATTSASGGSTGPGATGPAGTRPGGGGHFLRSGPAGVNNPIFNQALAKFAECLRQNGVNVPVPNTSGKGPVFSTKGLNTASPQFKAATMKCRGALVGAFRRPTGAKP